MKHKIYGFLSLGWTGAPRQWHRLEKAMQIMAIAIIPVAVSVHSIVSWDFAMAPVPMWHSTIFAPYFVAGAIFSGIAALIIAMALLRKFLHLEEYLLPIHFQNLGKLLLVMSLLWVYFVFSERLTGWYGNETSEMAVFWLTQTGPIQPAFLDDGRLQFPDSVPAARDQEIPHDHGLRDRLFDRRRDRHVARALPDHRAVAFAQILAVCLRRFALPPTWVEITITAGTFAGMAVLYMLFSKVVPIISVWELKWGQHPEEARDPLLARADEEEATA